MSEKLECDYCGNQVYSRSGGDDWWLVEVGAYSDGSYKKVDLCTNECFKAWANRLPSRSEA